MFLKKSKFEYLLPTRAIDLSFMSLRFLITHMAPPFDYHVAKHSLFSNNSFIQIFLNSGLKEKTKE